MSEGHSEGHQEESGATLAEPEPSPPAPAQPAQELGTYRRVAFWFAALLVVIVAGIALSPFWAPDLAPLLPWGARSAGSSEIYDDLARRLAAVEKRPIPPPVDVDAIKSTVSGLARRVDQLEAARDGNSQIETDLATTKTGVQQLEHRLTAVEAQSSSRAASEAAELQKIQQELLRLGNIAADLANRLPGLEQRMQSQNSAGRTDAALAVVLLRMREAVEEARPFPAEYAAFKALAHDPDLVAGTKPLADAAQSGVASRTVLSKRLAELAGRVATATEPPPETDWGAQALSRLRGLVTIRRIGGPSQTGPEAAVNAAQAALARGDLAGAVAALDPLTGANAEAARPWVQMARERLAVETALDHLQQVLEDRIGSAGPAPAAAPAEPSAKPRAPS